MNKFVMYYQLEALENNPIKIGVTLCWGRDLLFCVCVYDHMCVALGQNLVT